MYIRTIVVLANSIKHGKHCVAGKCTNTKKWIRPVSNTDGAELSNQQITFKNIYGEYRVKPLQKINMYFSRAAPLSHQPENWLIDEKRWEQNYSITKDELINYADSPESLWGKGASVPCDQINSTKIEQSLYLVNVEGLKLYLNNDGKRRATFTYKSTLNSETYDLPVTDPNFDALIDKQQKGEWTSNHYICVSLGEPYQNAHYKIVATIF